MSGYRHGAGSDTDQDRRINFRFNGKRYQGYHGDTLASALLASGVRVFGRSFKRHRPRGVFSAGVEEPGALVQVGLDARATPNARASLLAIHEGLEARTSSHWPSVNFDMARTFDLFSGLIPAGFYNKTFIWPSWQFYENLVRHTAGFGHCPKAPDPDQYAERHMAVDVLVCGGGPAGLAAALEYGASGASVLIAEQDSRFGGSLLSSPMEIGGEPSGCWLKTMQDDIAKSRNIEAFTHTSVSGIYDHNLALLVSHAPDAHARETLISARARKIIIAAGAIEQPLIFENNDRPGIMLLSAMQSYLQRFGVVAGKKIVLAGNNDLLYKAASDFAHAGVPIEAIIDSRAEPSAASAHLGLTVHHGCQVIASTGGKSLKGVTVTSLTDGSSAGRAFHISCDALGVTGGLAPTVHLACHANTPLAYDESVAAFAPAATGGDIEVIGAAAGNFDLDASLELIASGTMRTPVSRYSQKIGDRFARVGNTSKQWVDLLYDVTVADLDLAIRENYSSVEHMKRYTTNGMSVDQGKTSNLNALSHLAEVTERAISEVGTTTYRPPYMPVTLGTLAAGRRGRFYAPIRELPMHESHLALGAAMERYGDWVRPSAYPQSGEDEASAVNREALAVRQGVGVCDGSALGKIEVCGPDAAAFLNFIYLNQVPSLQVGQCRYGLMLNEQGVIFDDGVFCRLGSDEFLVSTTSANATRVYHWMEQWLQCELMNMDVTLMNATEDWANVTIAGPQARQLLSRFESDIDVSNEAFPFMSQRTGQFEGVPARILRVSFSGELGFEVYVPSCYGDSLWNEVLARGADLGVAPYGVETMMVLRIEKGFMHVGSDTDSQTVPRDVGWGHVSARKQADFIGKRSLNLPNNVRENRLELVGVEPIDPRGELIAGAHLTAIGEKRSQGYVTSACFSPMLNRPIGLALLEGGRGRMDEEIESFDCGIRRRVRVRPPVFFDAEGTRLHG